MLTDRFFVALASLFTGGEPLFIALGSGAAAWDEAVPEDDRSVGGLASEVARKAVAPEDVVFLDADGQETAEPSPRLRFRATFDPGEGTATLREAGLFGGGATADPGSGTLLAYYVHPRLEKHDQMSLERSLSIDLSPKPYAPGSRVTRWLGNVRTEELHDLDNLTERCQIDEIRFDRRFYLSGIGEAQELGYDFCAYCFGPELSER